MCLLGTYCIYTLFWGTVSPLLSFEVAQLLYTRLAHPQKKARTTGVSDNHPPINVSLVSAIRSLPISEKPRTIKAIAIKTVPMKDAKSALKMPPNQAKTKGYRERGPGETHYSNGASGCRKYRTECYTCQIEHI